MEEFGAGSVQQTTVAPAVKKGGKGALVAAVIFGLIAIGLGVALAFVLLNKPKDNDTANSGSNEDKSSSDAFVRGIVDDASKAYEEIVSDYGIEKNYDTYMVVPIADGVWMRVDHSYSFSLNGDENGSARSLLGSKKAAIDDAVAKVAEENGLSKSSLPKGKMMWDNEYFYYSNDSIVCYSAMGQDYSFSCTDKEWIKDEDKALSLAVADAFKKSRGNTIGEVHVRVANIKKNDAGTYELLGGSVMNAYGLFYRKVGEEDWKLFTATQDALPCSQYNTAELKEAYAGENCWDEATGEKSKVGQ